MRMCAFMIPMSFMFSNFTFCALVTWNLFKDGNHVLKLALISFPVLIMKHIFYFTYDCARIVFRGNYYKSCKWVQSQLGYTKGMFHPKITFRTLL
jgi:hypothetical protein